MANKYYTRGSRSVEESYIEEFERMRDELDTAFEGVETDTDANTALAGDKNAFENISCFCPDGTGAITAPILGETTVSGLPIKEACVLDDLDVTALVVATAGATDIVVENVTTATLIPLTIAAATVHQHFASIGLAFAPGDQLCIHIIGASDATLANINIVATLSKVAP